MGRLVQSISSLAIVLSAPALAVPSEETPPVPLSDPGLWASSDDYPAEAARARVEGVTRFSLTVEANGLVSACNITEPSGSEDLDRKTCELLLRNGKFTPAKDAKGKPVASRWSSAMRWQMPSLPPPPLGEFVITFEVNPDGGVSNCVIERAEGYAREKGYKPGPAARCPMNDFASGYPDAAGKPAAVKIRHTQRVEIIEMPAKAP